MVSDSRVAGFHRRLRAALPFTFTGLARAMTATSGGDTIELLSLPRDLLVAVLAWQDLGPRDLCRLEQTASVFQEFIKEEGCWEKGCREETQPTLDAHR